MTDEAHLSALEPGSGPSPRLPGALGDAGRPQGAGGAPRPRPQGSLGVTTLTRRADFLAANGGRRASLPGFVLLVRTRDDGDPAMRVGFTVTKKVGNAVVRNRMKRRLRALAREALPVRGVAGADHVLIGRSGGIQRSFTDLARDLDKALAKAAR